MDAKPISGLDALTTPTDADLLVTVSDGSNYKITKSNFLGSGGNTIYDSYNAMAFGWNNQVSYSDYGTASGYYNYVFYGQRNTAIGSNNEAYNENSTAIGCSNSANDDSSTAIGYNNSASGSYSTSCGYSNSASGNYSNAFGGENSAFAYCATAVGQSNNSANSSFAAGCFNNADSYSSIAIGNHNGISYSSNYSIVIGYDNFVYGGEATGESNICIGKHNISYYGFFAANNICIGTRNVNGSSYGGYGGEGGEKNTLIGYHNICYDDQGALIGYNNVSYEYRSAAFGNYNIINGDYSTGLGSSNTASGDYSTACGYNNTASAYCSTAIGTNNTTYANYSFVAGHDSTCGGERSVAIGYECDAEYDHSMAIGHGCRARAENSAAFGYYARTGVENTVNICGPIIIQKGQGSPVDYELYSGVETVLMSPEVDMTVPANLTTNSWNQGHAYKLIPSNSLFFPNEVGFIVTNINNVFSEPTIEFGTKEGSEIDVNLIHSATASGNGTGISLSFTAATLHNTLIAVCASDGVGSTVTAVLDSTALLMTQAAQYTAAGMTISIFYVENVGSGYTTVDFGFDSSVNARGFMFEYNGLISGLDENVIDDYSQQTGSSLSPSTNTVSTELSGVTPGSLFLSVIANEQDQDLTSPTAGFSLLSQGTFGSKNVAVFATSTKDITKSMIATSGTDVNFISVISSWHAKIQDSFDLIEAELLVDSVVGKRYRYLELGNGDGHNFLWAGVTDEAVVNEDGRFKGRFYWKGLLVENQ